MKFGLAGQYPHCPAPGIRYEFAAMGTYLNAITKRVRMCCKQVFGDFMRVRVFGFRNGVMRRLAASGFALLIGSGSAFAQSGDLRAQDQAKPPAAGQATPADAARDSQRKSDEFVEAAQAINGPAGNPECVWLGRRVVVLMWRDDLDTAFRHLDLYDRFGCPGGHVQATFRCLVRFGAIDPKAPESLSGRVHACWINPGAQPQASAAAQPATPATAGAAPGTPAPAAAAPAVAPAVPAK
jgi:hypothetical protein